MPALFDPESLYDGFAGIGGMSPMSIDSAETSSVDDDDDEGVWSEDLMCKYHAAKLEPGGYKNRFYGFYNSLLRELFPDGKFSVNPQAANALGRHGAIDFTVSRLSMTVSNEGRVELEKYVVFFVKVKDEIQSGAT